jgi:hypothetical protein
LGARSGLLYEYGICLEKLEYATKFRKIQQHPKEETSENVP